MMRALIFLLSMAFTTTAAHSTDAKIELLSRNAPVPNEDSPLEVDASYLELTPKALKDFKKHNSKWQCFRARIYKTNGEWRVAFVSNAEAKREGNYVVVGATPCGEGMTYVVSEAGKILRRIYQR